MQGLIGYYGLENWWLSELTSEERTIIQNKFQPLGSAEGSLTSGSISFCSQLVVGFLGNLAGWFNTPTHRPIAQKILYKAEQLAADASVLDAHFLYSQMVDIYYKSRADAAFLEKALIACQKQIDLAPKAAIAFHAQHSDSFLPEHRGYEQMVIYLEKAGRFQDAITVCEQAYKQGWGGDWEKRIERCKKKIKKA